MNRSFLAGAAGALAARALLPRVLMLKFRRDVATLNAGDAAPLLKSYADDAVLHFNPGDHRWGGDWVGKPAITRFMRNFTAAKIQGEIIQLWTAGPPWALTMIVRFDDFAEPRRRAAVREPHGARAAHALGQGRRAGGLLPRHLPDGALRPRARPSAGSSRPPS